MTINILAYFPSIIDATSFYRGFGPFANLRKISDVNVIRAPDVCTWAELSMCDILFLQRPAGINLLNICKLAKHMSIPIWIDYDDDLFSVPESNPAHNLYAKDEVRKTMAEIIATVDVISVTTNCLREKLLPLNKNIVVIPNALNDYIFKKEPLCEQQNSIVFWRGSKTHKADLNLAGEGVLTLCKQFPNWTWQFLGDTPWFADYMPKQNVICTKPIDPIAYFDYLQIITPAITIVPLQNNEFNHAKSNIAWLETSFAGGCTLAPDFEEWEKPGVTHYTDGADFEAQLLTLLEASDEHRLQKAKQSWHYVKEQLMLSEVNKLRAELINNLLGG